MKPREKNRHACLRYALLFLLQTIVSIPALAYEPVLLDIGHGGTDGGTSGPCGTVQIVENASRNRAAFLTSGHKILSKEEEFSCY